MNDALQKLYYFIESNFWDWQFISFLIFSVVFTGLYFLGQKSNFKLIGFFDFSPETRGKREIWSYLLLGSASLLPCFLIILFTGAPVPQAHDEFGYLLAADTFLHGRIVNPTPFSPRHFEYFHILLKPVYAAKYPPLQGVFLAAGTLISGEPIAGVFLAGIVSTLAVYWFLRYFFSRGWSLYGGFLWIAAPLNLIWSNSYWGGHAAVIGGALSLGAFFRFRQSRKNKYLFVWGAGILILLNSRLYEGTILTAILVLLWFFEVLKNKKAELGFYSAISVFGLIISINLLFIAFYNFSVTRSFWLLPYSLQHSQYHQTPLFVFQNPDAPTGDVPEVMKKLDERWTAEIPENNKNWFSAAKTTLSRIPVYLFWLTRSPFLIALFLAGLVFAFRQKDEPEWRKSLIIFGLFIAGLLLTTFSGDRFIAPVVGIFIGGVTLAAKSIYQKAVFLRPWILFLPLIIGAGFLYGMLSFELKRVKSAEINPENLGSRRQIENLLNLQPGKHLLFLETTDVFPADARFYVYNRAEIEDSKIVWAHKLSFDENAALLEHFKDRSVWLLKNVNQRAVLVRFENQVEKPGFVK